jgi:hypothetical protein
MAGLRGAVHSAASGLDGARCYNVTFLSVRGGKAVAGGVSVRWFRQHRGSATAVALFALLVQFALSFGHVHVGGGYPGALASHFAASTTTADTVSALPQGHSHDPGPARDDLCPICLVNGMLASAGLAEPPVLPAPPLAIAVVAPFAAAHVPATSRRAGFQSRAPPEA